MALIKDKYLLFATHRVTVYTLANSVTPMCANSSPHNIITHKNISGFPIAVNFAEWRKL
jgi:hypothetical protein